MSVAHITTREHGDILARSGELRDHLDVQGLCRIGHAPHWLWCSGELVPLLIGGSTWESRLCTLPRQHSGTGPGGGGEGRSVKDQL